MLTTAQRAPVYVDGELLLEGVTTGYVTGDSFVIVAVEGVIYVEGVAPGESTLHLQKGTRTGTLTIDVQDEPLLITLGDPEPK